jgi:microcystin-dependent protein
MPYLTPETLPPAGGICRPLLIPNDELIVAAVSGALYDLTLESNWEPFGAVTPAAIAAAMLEMLESYFTEPCCTEAAAMPIGVVFPYVTASPPAGSVPCDGTIYLDTDYPDLWAIVDPLWKTDSTHWQAPDMSDRFPVGAGNLYDPGDTGGENAHSLTASENALHTHGNYAVSAGGTGRWYAPFGQTSSLTSVSPSMTYQGSGDAHENRPPYLALSWAVQVA